MFLGHWQFFKGFFQFTFLRYLLFWFAIVPIFVKRAKIGGDVICTGGNFGVAAVSASENNGRMEQVTSGHQTPTKVSLRLARAIVTSTLWLSGENSKFDGGVELTGAKIGRIVDSLTELTRRRATVSSSTGSRDDPAFLRLDGLTYDRFGGETDVTAGARVAFLRLQSEADLGNKLKPQPWIQMIKVLRESGHTEAAREVAIEFEKQRRRAGLIKRKTFWAKLPRGLHRLYGIFVGYGHRPMRLIEITLGIWLACGIVYHIAAVEGVFTPSNPLVFQNPAYMHSAVLTIGNSTS